MLLTELRRREPSSLFVLQWLVTVVRKQGHQERAAELVKAGLDQNPRSLELLALLAGINAELGRHAEAVPLWRAALTIGPERGELWHALTKSLEKLGDQEGAAATGERALVRYIMNGNKDGALSAAHDLVALVGFGQGWLYLANTLAHFGDQSSAAQVARQAYREDPSRIDAIKAAFFFSVIWEAPETLIAEFGDLAARPLPDPSACWVHRFLLLLGESEERRRRGLSVTRARSLADIEIQFRREQFARWRQIAERWFRAEPRSPDAAENYACALFLEGQFAETEAPVAVIRAANPRSEAVSYLAARASYAELEASGAGDIAAGLPPARILAETPGAAEVTIFVGCDQAYFDRYGLALAGSILRADAGLGLHIHVFDADEAALRAQFDTIVARHRVRLRITVERTDAGEADKKVYYHAVRFIRFAQFLPLYAGSVWMLDADLLCMRGPASLIGALGDADLALTLLPARIEPRNKIAAGILGVSTSAIARRYMELVAAYLARLRTDGWLRWGADQVALFLVLRYLLSTGTTPRVAPLDESFLSDKLSDDPIFWVPKLEPGHPDERRLADLRRQSLLTVGVTGR